MKVPYLYLLNNTTWLITLRVSRSKLQLLKMVLESTVAAGFSKFKIVSFNPELLNVLQRLFIVLNHF